MRPLQDCQASRRKLELKSIIKNMLENNLSNDKSLEVYVVISQKNLTCTIFDKKTDKIQNERKS